jgi:hypothetical protein
MSVLNNTLFQHRKHLAADSWIMTYFSIAFLIQHFEKPGAKLKEIFKILSVRKVKGER